jgi:hypothetical protein
MGRPTEALSRGLSRPVAGGGVFVTPQALAVVNAFTTPPTEARRNLVIDTVNKLATSTIWAKLDVFYMLAAADAQAARVNWKQPGTYDASVVGSPVFGVDTGYNSASNIANYLNTNFNPSSSTRVQSQDSAHMGVWSRTAGSNGNGAVGNTNATVLPFSVNVMNVRLNGASGLTATNDTGVGHYVGSRTSSVGLRIYKNGALTNTSGSNTSSAPANENYYVCVRNQATDSTGSNEFACFHCGSSLQIAEVATLYNIIRPYLVAVGAA